MPRRCGLDQGLDRLAAERSGPCPERPVADRRSPGGTRVADYADQSGREAVEKRIQSETADDPVIARLMTLAGVGLVTAATMRAEIGRFDRFDTGKQLARFCGVTPRNASSGARQADAGLIRAGNPQLRTLLIELAHRLIRTSNPRWGSLAANMLRRGKPKNVVIAAVANRWVRWLYHELKRDPKDPSASGQALQKGAAPSIPAVAST